MTIIFLISRLSDLLTTHPIWASTSVWYIFDCCVVMTSRWHLYFLTLSPTLRTLAKQLDKEHVRREGFSEWNR